MDVGDGGIKRQVGRGMELEYLAVVFDRRSFVSL